MSEHTAHLNQQKYAMKLAIRYSGVALALARDGLLPRRRKQRKAARVRVAELLGMRPRSQSWDMLTAIRSNLWNGGASPSW
jgi:hypothetical protein